MKTIMIFFFTIENDDTNNGDALTPNSTYWHTFYLMLNISVWHLLLDDSLMRDCAAIVSQAASVGRFDMLESVIICPLLTLPVLLLL